ncbi:hypothetical protein DBR06_SOUSAS24510020 [Sousa chinensis]|nr:hypothetical protein DBR06_SOUSAS24510020 [Sousa chinensis]
MQWVVEDERRAPFRLAFEALDASIQEGAKSAGPSVVETQHRNSEEEAQDACVSAVAGGTVVSGELGGAKAELAERHAGDGGEGEDGEEYEGAGDQESQASVVRGRHGEQHVGQEPEAERHPAGRGPVEL